MHLGDPLSSASRGAPAELDAFDFVLAGLAPLAARCETFDDTVRDRLDSATFHDPALGVPLLSAFATYLCAPAREDSRLAAVSRHFQLTPLETLAVRLCVAAEQDLLTGHLLSHLQQPLARSRPTLGLLAQAFGEGATQAHGGQTCSMHVLGQGNGVRCGLLQLCGEDVPLPERQVRVPLPIAFALQDASGSDLNSRLAASAWPGVSEIEFEGYSIPLGPTAEAYAASVARQLILHGPRRVTSPALVIRCGDPLEARAAAQEVCAELGKRAVLVSSPTTSAFGATSNAGAPPADTLHGLAPWLVLNELLPVFSQWLTPGERRPLPSLSAYDGPMIILSGPEGEFDSTDRQLIDWRLATPVAAERVLLWQLALANHPLNDTPSSSELATNLARNFRHSAGRIAMLAHGAQQEARAETPPAPVTHMHVRRVSRRGESVGLGSLAELVPDEVDDNALVIPAALRSDLEALALRCRLREQFPASLGVSLQARYRPSVRALLVGPSGTGKTLAASWLATRLGIPLFRVDLSAITSKYIGETEKNLSQLLARAEQSEVLLLFDEADSLFGKRTDISDSNDRFANAQTNYLLQRMESYDGITVLTSNVRSRFDDAFSRRFDAILTFPLPAPEERRALWLAHLGPTHSIPHAQLNLLAATAELTGGQIRNAVLHAAVAAHADNTSSHASAEVAIQANHLLAGVSSEYRKLSRQLPNELTAQLRCFQVDSH